MLLPASNLIALVVACPSVLADASAEEFWLHAPMQAGWQQEIHHLITEHHIDNEALTAEGLWESLREEASAAACSEVARAMEALAIDLAKDDVVRYAHANRLWGEVINDVERARLRAEYGEAETALGREMNEENLERFMVLKSQIEAIDRERSRFYREDPLINE